MTFARISGMVTIKGGDSVDGQHKPLTRYLPHVGKRKLKSVLAVLVGFMLVGLQMMCYTSGKEKRTCLGDFQLSGLIGKLLY